MNIRRIIREEMNSLSDSFYLIVSTDEKYIYGSIENQTHAGNKFRPIKDYTIKDIVNSKYISYEQAEHPIEWSKSTLKNGANVTTTQIELANNILKYNPKIITIDLILNKRDDNFPMMESEIDEFDWVKDVEPRLPLRVGTCLTFKHSKEEEEWVEDEYGNMIDHGKMNWHITSKFIDVYNDDKPTFSMVATDRMGESRQIFMEVEKVKELYEEGVYEPCKKQPYLKRVMKKL